MPLRSTARRQRSVGLLACGLILVAAAGAPSPAHAAKTERTRLDRRGDDRATPPAATRAARRELRASLGRFALLSTDVRTGAVRTLARLDGALTGRSSAAPAAVARAYARRNAAVLGLDAAAVDALRLARRRQAPEGEQLTFEQSLQGIPAVDFGLRATVDNDGRLVALGGAPRDLTGVSTQPLVDAEAAYRSARRAGGDVTGAPAAAPAEGPARTTRFDGGETASLVLYDAGTSVRLGWRVFTRPSSTEYYDTVVDARSGLVQRRANLVTFASGLVYLGSPGAGPAVNRTLTLSAPGNRLVNDRVHAFLDPQDLVKGRVPVDGINGADEVGPRSSGSDFDYQLTSAPGVPASICPAAPPGCTWNPFVGGSWNDADNDKQSATQLFFSVNTFLEHLAADPGIGFGETTSGFGGNGPGADPIYAQAMDGANLAGDNPNTPQAEGLPDAQHQSNANMLVLPDGQPGFLQTYLFDPRQSATANAVSGANDASIVFHEVAHGMVHRLVTDSQGYGAVGGPQPGAIDEGLADYYALDYLVAQGLMPATDVRFGTYGDRRSLRRQAIDCAVENRLGCAAPAGGTAGPGGFTYEDFGRVGGQQEVHTDSEIWGQTMWQLRSLVGVADARRLITAALRIVPERPTFLDMRNAILLANPGDDAPLWELFRQRGMGYFASTEGPDDVAPTWSYDSPPAPGERTGLVRGTVREAGGGPQAGVSVAFAGHEALGAELEAVTGADGRYLIAAVPRTYPQLTARGRDGLMTVKRPGVTVVAGENTQDFALRRNVAAAAAGGQIVRSDFPDYSLSGCGPSGLIDGGSTVWGSLRPAPREIVVRLATPIALGDVQIDPTAGCGDPAASALGSFRVEVAATDTPSSYVTVSSGTLGTENRSRLNPLALSAKPAAVRYVKLVALGTQASATEPDNGFMDVAELAVFDVAAGPPDTPTVPLKPPDGGGSAGGGGGGAGGGTTTTPPSTPTVPTPQPTLPTPTPVKARKASVTCTTKRGRSRTRLSCRLRNLTGARRAKLTLTRSGRTLGRAQGSVRSGRLPGLSLKRTARRSYRLTVVVTRTGGRKQTVRRLISV